MAEISFGEWLRRRRKALDLTQEQLAQKINCSTSALRKLEAEERRPSEQIVQQLAGVFKIPSQERATFLKFARGILAVSPTGVEEAPWHGPSRTSTHSNLPASLTSFIGREKEQAEILKRINQYRLVTLVGSGGVGKTRLALRVGEQLVGEYAHGVWLVELAPILDPQLVPRTTAIVIGLRDEPQRLVIDMLSDYLREKQMLIILDNCEHLLDPCAQLADTLLKRCPHLKMLATSREALGILGEAVYRVPSLQLPDLQEFLGNFREYESVRLFEERAQLAQMNFSLTMENISSVARICNRLDGIPLAIELAAARVCMFSTEQIAARLQESFHLLATGNRAALPRHQTLQATIDWSYHLLLPHEQTLFRRLSVFVNGWTLKAAESICSDTNIKSQEVLNLLSQLVEKSLINTEEVDGDKRYGMLETIRQYADEKLMESGEYVTLRDKHLEYFLNLAETAEPHLRKEEQIEWLNQLDADLENLRAALECALNKDLPELSLRLCAALGTFWSIRRFWLEGSKWTEGALSKPSQNAGAPEKTARVRAFYQDAALANGQDDIERMQTSAELSLSLAEKSTDKRDIAIAQFYVGFAFYRRNQIDDARSLMEQSLVEFREMNDSYWEVYAFMQLGYLPDVQGMFKRDAWILQSLELARKAEERLNLADALRLYSDLCFRSNRFNEGVKYLEEADLLYKQMGNRSNATTVALAMNAWLNGDYKKAKSLLVELQEHLGLLGEQEHRSQVISRLGWLALEQGNLEQAQAYFEEALATARDLQNQHYIVCRLAEMSTVFYLKGNIDQYKEHLKKGILLVKVLSTNTKLYFLLVVLDSIHLQEPETTALILGAISAFESYNLYTIGPWEKRFYDRAELHSREVLSHVAFESVFEKGKKVSLDQTLDLIWKTVEEI